MGEGAGFEVGLACPACGARLTVAPETLSVRCACGATLGCGWHGREAVFGLEARLRDEAQLRGALLLESVARHGAELRARGERAGVERDALDPTVEEDRRRRLKAFEREQAAALRLVEAHRLALPLWRLWGHELALESGPDTAGGRRLGLSAVAWAETLAGHDPRLGLRLPPPRLERARARPLQTGSEQRFVPWQPAPDTRASRATEPPTVRTVCLRAGARRALLYWPCWLARVIDGDRQDFVLVDALAGAVLARPAAPAARALLSAAVADPEASAARTPAVQVWQAACPECRNPVSLAGRERLVFCEVCRRALAITPAGLGPRPYACAVAQGGAAPEAYLPFWSFSFRVETGAGEPLARLELLRERFIPRGAGAALGGALLVPAFEALDESLLGAWPLLLSQAHSLAWQVQDGGLDPGGTALCAPATLDEAGARELAPLALLTALGPQAFSRLAGIASGTPRLLLGTARLLLLGCEQREGRLALPGQSPLLPAEPLLGPAPPSF